MADRDARIRTGFPARFLALLRRWGIRNEQEANEAGIDWPATRYKDIWSWQDVHESWLKDIEDDHPGVHKLIEATQEIHGDGTAAYLCYMAVRLFEIRRVLKDSGSLYLHCDHTAGAYLRQLLDAIFGKENFRNEIVWRIGWVSGYKTQKRGWIRNHDTILYFVKTSQANAQFNKEYVPYPKGYVRRDGKPPTGKGIPIEDTWNCSAGDVLNSIMIESFSKEKTGYPTQKPVALAERIIKASCPEGGVVLDCFAGCAYVAIAAERLNRNWIACDINPRAWTVFKRQFAKPKLAPLKCAEPMPADNLQQRLFGSVVTVHGPGELPTRDTPEEEQTPPTFRLPDKPRTFKTPASVIPEREMLEILLGMSGYQAWCCGFANRKPDGSIVETTRNFHLDHMDPVSKPGFSHQITNRAPLCPHHNIMKSNRRLHLAEYREEIAKDGELMVNDLSDLMDLTEAAHRTLNIYASRIQQGTLPL